MLRVAGIDTNKTRLPYTSTNVGELKAPDYLPGYVGISNSEMERNFRKIDGGIDRRIKRKSFEDRFETPFLLKYILAGGFIYVLWKSIKK